MIQRVADVFRTLLAGGLDQFEALMAPLADLAKLFATLAEGLLPIMKVLQQVNAALIGLVGGVVSVLAEVLGMLLEAINPLVEIFSMIAGMLVSVTKVVFDWAGALLKVMLTLNPLVLMFQWMREVLQPVADLFAAAQPIFAALWVVVQGVINMFKSLSLSLGQDIFGAVTSSRSWPASSATWPGRSS